MHRDEDRDYSSDARRAVERERRRLAKIETKAEASENQLQKLIRRALKDPNQRQAIAKDCLDGFKGNKTSTLEVTRNTQLARKLHPDDLVHGAEGVTDRSITGFEDRYWDDDDDEDY